MTKPGPKPRDVLDRIADKFTVGDSCWEWTAYISPQGYGKAYIAPGRQVTAHRALYEIMVGPVPAGMEVDHLCRNRRCVRPDHLEAVTPAENNRRGIGPVRTREARYAQTHCLRGHLLPDPGPNGKRRCRPCMALRARKYREVSHASG